MTTTNDHSVAARPDSGAMTDATPPDPEVPERSRGRRQFSAKYESRILAEHNASDRFAPGALPHSWCDTQTAFLLLSDGYRDDAATARAHGWPVVERMGGHLDIVNEPEMVAGELIDIAHLDA